jgi:putative tryptophan/tyrosine transport system substrate-binding protein
VTFVTADGGIARKHAGTPGWHEWMIMIHLNRRQIIALFGAGLILRPARTTAQAARPVIGYLGAENPNAFASRIAAFRQGLRESGYVEGENITILFRWAESEHSRLPALAADLINLHVDVIVAPGGAPAALAAKSQTKTIPIVFEMGADPVVQGLVSSLNRPGGNITGVASLNVELAPKRLELLRELLPSAPLFAVLVNPSSPTTALQLSNLKAAALDKNVALRVLEASNSQELKAAFATLPEQKASGIVVASDTFLGTHGEEVAALTLQYGIPAIHQSRDFTAAGGLMSYGGNFLETNRLAGVWVARILKGERPGDLPIQQITKFEMGINLKTAKALGLQISDKMLIRANFLVEAAP